VGLEAGALGEGDDVATQNEIRAGITARILQALQAGDVPPWRRPWRAATNGGLPANAVTKKPYRGINVLLLGCRPYPSRWWATYRQWRELGGQVRQGERGTRIVFWRPIEKETVNAAGEVETEAFILLREYTVFNAEQCEGQAVQRFLVQLAAAGDEGFANFGPAEEAIRATGADIRFGGNKAAYFPDLDFIQMPAKSAFESAVAYYTTLAHELCHWAGHPSRLDRLSGNARFGSRAYAFEELVAEIGGCFLGAELGLPQSDDLSNHQAYLGHWLGVLRQDSGAILRAAGQASRAVDYILGFSRKADAGAAEAGEEDEPHAVPGVPAYRRSCP
jgi:antirestriction protein ArdC